jgi:hypothetical protein
VLVQPPVRTDVVLRHDLASVNRVNRVPLKIDTLTRSFHTPAVAADP